MKTKHKTVFLKTSVSSLDVSIVKNSNHYNKIILHLSYYILDFFLSFITFKVYIK